MVLYLVFVAIVVAILTTAFVWYRHHAAEDLKRSMDSFHRSLEALNSTQRPGESG